MKKWKNRLARLAWLSSLLWAASLGTAEAPPGYSIPPAIWDVQTPRGVFPGWFGPVYAQAGLNMYTWRAQVRPPAGEAKLALTLVFREPSDGFARVIWQGPGRAVTLCGNLYERAASLHQRTLLLDRDTLVGPGQIIVESTGTVPVLERVELVWVEPLVLAAGWAAPPGLYLTPAGKILPAEELHGDGRRAPSDEDKGAVMDAVLDAGPVKIDPLNPVRFLASIAGQPAYGRLEAQVAGMAPGEEPVIGVNGRALSGLAAEVPGLDDPGYRQAKMGQEMNYGGWRKVVAYVPVGFLRSGENQVDWQSATGTAGMTLRNLRLQVVFVKVSPPVENKPISPVAPAVAPRDETPVVTRPMEPAIQPRPQLRTGLSSGGGVVGLRTE
ncbi:MAG: hypothetical protein NTZ01_08280 [Verrucomicrobia bacterium]|nr:hypothetical protein [Verrucomicrobiota bacterium]